MQEKKQREGREFNRRKKKLKYLHSYNIYNLSKYVKSYYKS